MLNGDRRKIEQGKEIERFLGGKGRSWRFQIGWPRTASFESRTFQ